MDLQVEQDPDPKRKQQPIWEFPKVGAPYFGVLIISVRILLFIVGNSHLNSGFPYRPVARDPFPMLRSACLRSRPAVRSWGSQRFSFFKSAVRHHVTPRHNPKFNGWASCSSSFGGSLLRRLSGCRPSGIAWRLGGQRSTAVVPLGWSQIRARPVAYLTLGWPLQIGFILGFCMNEALKLISISFR